MIQVTKHSLLWKCFYNEGNAFNMFIPERYAPWVFGEKQSGYMEAPRDTFKPQIISVNKNQKLELGHIGVKNTTCKAFIHSNFYECVCVCVPSICKYSYICDKPILGSNIHRWLDHADCVRHAENPISIFINHVWAQEAIVMQEEKERKKKQISITLFYPSGDQRWLPGGSIIYGVIKKS